MKYKSIKIPLWAYQNALALRSDIARVGLDAIPADITAPARCPRCDRKVTAVVIDDDDFVTCACGYSQPRRATAGLGVLLGLGVAALHGRTPMPTHGRKKR